MQGGALAGISLEVFPGHGDGESIIAQAEGLRAGLARNGGGKKDRKQIACKS